MHTLSFEELDESVQLKVINQYRNGGEVNPDNHYQTKIDVIDIIEMNQYLFSSDGKIIQECVV